MKKSGQENYSRRKFLLQSGALLGGALLAEGFMNKTYPAAMHATSVPVNGHLWVYASKYPPEWDSTPDLETVFSDLKYAGIAGVELMNANLRHHGAVENLNNLIKKYQLPVSGSSYGAAMWQKAQHQEILEDVTTVITRLGQVGGKTFGISVGDARRLKTEKELDDQAGLLKKIVTICANNGIEANLHNHTYEMINQMHDLKGTLSRIPDIKLGPDLNWLIRAGINPVEFIHTYGKQMAYMHIRDQYANGEWTEYLGQGVTDFPAIAKALTTTGFKGRVAIELAFPANFKPLNPLKEDWKLSRAYVAKTFGW